MILPEYSVSKFIGVAVSQYKIEIAELKGAAEKTIGNNKKVVPIGHIPRGSYSEYSGHGGHWRLRIVACQTAA